ncbi:MAG: hypothetical protein M1482_03145 [Chloroflexi bacterium]|nr:hypothetical protein [Chloroflexota bacterium]
MATAQRILSNLTDDLGPIGDRVRPNDVRNQARPVRVPSLVSRVGELAARRPGLAALGMTYVAGMLLGWLVIGWWLWPVQWTTYTPGQSSADYEHLFVNWAANRYWETKDAAQARQAFATWNRDDLAKLISDMEHSAKDTETRRNLVALEAALELPVSDTSVLAFAWQPGVLIGVFLSVLPLMGVFAFVGLPRLRRRLGVGASGDVSLPDGVQAEDSLDELMSDVEGGGAEDVAVTLPGEEQKEEEKTEDKESEEDAEGQSSGLGDLASLFEEEDTSINALEAFCKGMPDVSVDDLIAKAADVLQKLRQGNSLMLDH